MKKFTTIALSILLTGLFTLTFAWSDSNNTKAENISAESSSETFFDKESDFKYAHDKKGCKSIPYSSEKSKCKSLHDKQKVACTNTSCKTFEHLYDEAFEDENQREMDRILREATLRQNKGTECKRLRKEIMVLFKKVESRVKREKSSFESSLRRDNSPAKIEYYERMIEYADEMLETYSDSKPEHAELIKKAGETYAVCKKFNDKY